MVVRGIPPGFGAYCPVLRVNLSAACLVVSFLLQLTVCFTQDAALREGDNLLAAGLRGAPSSGINARWLRSSVEHRQWQAVGAPAPGKGSGFSEDRGSRLRQVVLQIAWWSTCAAVGTSLWLILDHLASYTKPDEQKWIIGCIFMVPLYAVCSFLALWAFHLHWLLNLLRDCYEAAALYSFGMYLTACLGGEDIAVAKLSRRLQDLPSLRLWVANSSSISARSAATPDLSTEDLSSPRILQVPGTPLEAVQPQLLAVPAATRSRGPAIDAPPLLEPLIPGTLVAHWPSLTPSRRLPAGWGAPVAGAGLDSKGRTGAKKQQQQQADLLAAALGHLEAERMPLEVHAHPRPLSWLLAPWPHGRQLVTACKFGIVQYMILKFLSALMQLALDPWNLYKEGEMDLQAAYPYVALVLNCSQCWAFYCLVVFYHAAWPYLVHIQPLSKLLLIKAVVFVTWWQSLAVSALFSSGLLRPPRGDISLGLLFQNALQDFLVCIEMAVAAGACLWVFPAEPFKECDQPQGSASGNLVGEKGAWGGLARLGVQPGWARGMGHVSRLDASRVRVLANMADTLAPVDPQEVIESETIPLDATGGGGGAADSATEHWISQTGGVAGGWEEEYAYVVPRTRPVFGPLGGPQGSTGVGQSWDDVVWGGSQQVYHDVHDTLQLAVEPLQERMVQWGQGMHGAIQQLQGALAPERLLPVASSVPSVSTAAILRLCWQAPPATAQCFRSDTPSTGAGARWD